MKSKNVPMNIGTFRVRGMSKEWKKRTGKGTGKGREGGLALNAIYALRGGELQIKQSARPKTFYPV